MRSIVLGLFVSFALPVFAENTPTIDPPAPLERSQKQGKPVGSVVLRTMPEIIEQGNDEEKQMCEALVVELNAFKLDSDNLENLRKEKLAVDAALAEDIDKQYRIYGVSEMRAIKKYWRVVSLIARGDTRELLPILRPIFGAVYTNANIMISSLDELKKLRNGPVIENQAAADRHAAKLKAEKEKYVAAAKLFGANYPDFIRFKRLLQKTIDSEPVEDAADAAVAAGKPEERVVLLHMTTKRAKDAATSAMKILTSPFEQQWLVSSTKRIIPDSMISTLYVHSMDAKLAFESKNLEDQKGSRNIFLKGVQILADFYLHATDRSWVPERYRVWILRAMGVAYRSLMMERYLDKIEAVVNSTHAIEPNGDFVIETDNETLELAMKTMREFRNTGVGNDYLKTFALLGWRTDEWLALKRYVKKKADATKDETTAYTKLYADMVDAEKERDSMPEYTFAYEPATRHELMFVGTQIFYLLAQEEFWRRWGIDWFHQAANYFF